MLRLNEDTWYRDQTTLKQHIEEFYCSLYESEGPREFQPILDICPTVINAQMNESLLIPISMEEVKEAVFQLGSLKALGPDGLNGQFYQHYGEEIKLDVLNMVRNFFESGEFDPLLNKTYITLIPKVKTTESICQFKPTSLCNFSYKIISKVLANILKPWLDEIIAYEQSAFVKGRQIQDNIFIVQEVLH